jgi:hypothetical protein
MFEGMTLFEGLTVDVVSTDTKESLRIFLIQQLRDVEEDINTISSYISCNPPETTGELLKLRELQRKYREIAASIKKEIVKLG